MDDMTGPLVSAGWLGDHLRDEFVRIVDCRFSLSDPQAGRRAYEAGHLPGAIYLDLERDLSASKAPGGEGGRHPLPDPQTLAARLGEIGIGDDSFVVAYDDPPAGGMFAARLWWLLRWLGHDKVAVLNGGLRAWTESGGEVEEGEARYPKATFTPQVRGDLVTDAAGVLARPGTTTLVDSRARARYAGEVEPIDKKAGHIPGAVNLDWAASLDEAGRLKSPAEQAARFSNLGDEVIVYCGSGVSAATNLLALELAGREPGANTRLYAGSWSDWISDPSREVATGSEA